VIRQRGSWGRFEISAQGFSNISGNPQTYGPFLDIVSLFGLKSNSRADDFTRFSYRFDTFRKDRDSYGKRLCRSRVLSTYSGVSELCYNVRYMYHHGRAGEYPWSFRQTAVYQRSSVRNSRSRWIFLHPPSTIESSLADIFANEPTTNMRDYICEPLYAHLLLLLSTESGWRPFLEHLETEVEDLVSWIAAVRI
jgi:hypothetical protein